MLLDPQGPREKWCRANKHLGELHGLIEKHLGRGGEPYTLAVQPHEDAPEYVDVFAVRVKPLPSLELGVVIGDVVHNLRAALDQLVWTLTVQHQGRVAFGPFDRGCWWRGVRFPLANSVHDWDSGIDRAVMGIDPDLVPMIKDEQPFPTGEGGKPERTQLRLLNDLWNRDKHRSPAVVAAKIGEFRTNLVVRMNVLLMAAYRQSDPYIVHVLRQASGEIKEGEELARVRFSQPVTTAEASHHLNDQARLAIDVAFEDGPPADGAPVRKTLDGMADAVKEILDRFEPRLFPTGDYPASHCPDPEVPLGPR